MVSSPTRLPSSTEVLQPLPSGSHEDFASTLTHQSSGGLSMSMLRAPNPRDRKRRTPSATWSCEASHSAGRSVPSLSLPIFRGVRTLSSFRSRENLHVCVERVRKNVYVFHSAGGDILKGSAACIKTYFVFILKIVNHLWRSLRRGQPSRATCRTAVNEKQGIKTWMASARHGDTHLWPQPSGDPSCSSWGLCHLWPQPSRDPSCSSWGLLFRCLHLITWTLL